jgi:predicted nucleic acid-binding protein
MKNIALDATVIINLLDVSRLDLLPQLTSHTFFLSNHVRQEIHYRSQRIRLTKAIKNEWMEVVEISDIAEMETYARYRTRFGQGESACLALGLHRSWIVASDDRAVRREILNTRGSEWFTDTLGILKEAADSNVLSESDFAIIRKRLGFQE